MTGIIAALVLAGSVTLTALDVPYLPQTNALCGGAAAAMVFRYWGAVHAQVDKFKPLVDRRAGGIAASALVDAIEREGWIVARVGGSLAAVDERLAAREPVIVLLADRGIRYHYVVVVGHHNGFVIVHDPSWGPSRPISEREFLMRWEKSNFWSIVVRAGTVAAGVRAPVDRAGSEPSDTISQTAGDRADACDRTLRDAIVEARQGDLEAAAQVLSQAQRACPNAAGPLREIAGIRFAQKRWRDAAALANAALERDRSDEYAVDVLASSLFMMNDEAGALGAWNRIQRPRLDRVRIEGLHHSRYQAIADALRLQPGMLLTAADFERARRRVAELPDQVTARLDLRPDADGFAIVDVVVAERSSIPDNPTAWSGLAVSAAVDREVTATLPGVGGQGDAWTGAWRFWTNRPRLALALASPGFAGLPGIWRVDASWDAQSYAFTNSAAPLRESRVHAAISVSDWVSANWRYSVTMGVDEWSTGASAGSIGGGLERRVAHDRLSLLARGDVWIGHRRVPGVTSIGVRGNWTSAPVITGWSYAAVAGWQRVSDNAPLGLWPGASDGHGRGELLRAHPILDDGIVRATEQSAFGRTLTFGSTEAQRWLATRWPSRIGLAAFADVAQAGRDARGLNGAVQLDIGAGLRVRVPGVSRVLRIDVAHGVRDGANALSVGWVF